MHICLCKSNFFFVILISILFSATTLFADSYPTYHGDLGSYDQMDPYGESINRSTQDGNLPYRFRIFIPPGTKGAKFTLIIRDDCGDTTVVASFGSPPKDTRIPENVGNSFSDLNEIKKKGQVFSKRRGTHQTVKILDHGDANGLGVDDSGWLYIKIIKDYQFVRQGTFSFRVDGNIYDRWYKTITWDEV